MRKSSRVIAILFAAIGALTVAPISFADTIAYTVVSTATGQMWTWTLPQNPVPDVVFPDAFEFLSVPVSMNGAASIPYFFEFTDTGAPGGGGWMGFECQPFLVCNWDIIEGLTFGANLFSGSTADPTLLTGTYTSTMPFPDYPTAIGYPTLTATITPEPSSLVLCVMGVVSVLLIRKCMGLKVEFRNGMESYEENASRATCVQRHL
jgi:hypothetical protein